MIRYFTHILPLALVLAVAASTSSLAQTFTDDFNDGDDAGWTRVDPIGTVTGGAVSSSYSFPGGNTYRIQAAGSPNPQALGPARAGSARLDINQTAFTVGVDVVDWDDSLNQAFGVAARAREIGFGTTDSYVLFYSAANHQFAIDRLENEMDVDLDSESGPGCNCDHFVDITLDPANDYRFVFSGVGPALTGQLFDLADLATPLATVTAVDDSLSSGVPGLLSVYSFPAQGTTDFTTGTDTTFDNFTATNIPEPASLALAALGGLMLLGRHWRG